MDIWEQGEGKAKENWEWGEGRAQDNLKAPCQDHLALIKEGRRKCVGVGGGEWAGRSEYNLKYMRSFWQMEI